MREYYQRNRERLRQQNAQYQAAHRDEANARSRTWYAKRKSTPEFIEHRRDWGRRNYRKNRDREILKVHLRQRFQGNGDLTQDEWDDVVYLFDYRCAYCSRKGKLTLDHVIPISRGGEHTKSNVVPACPECNFSKGAKLLSEWKRV